ncbi:NUDIX hydrolase [Pandoraea oxalativorans]|uniref:Phosphatase NudJ n=1 Tax=Pandoraea oxalativorans TaxID=573737 RepID=A0A0E3YAX6_9BURK|nr:NUDIX hydrolase [Pandoraea oxalativorans]AKC69597.1 NUDIX hydrolase [Pandoraea oxalativorans]
MNARWKPNVTVAAVVERDGRFLFVEEQKRAGLLINQPAGHLEPGESILDAVRREVLEETAHRFEPQHLLGIYLAPGPEDIAYLRFTFSGTLGEFDATRTLDDGIVGTLWLTPEEVRAQRARHRSPILEQCMDDYLRGVRYDLGILQTYPALTGGQGNT